MSMNSKTNMDKYEMEVQDVAGDLSVDDDDDVKAKLEDVRMSNFAYSQTKISEYISYYFASVGVGSAIIASEMCAGFNDNGQTDDYIHVMLIICNVSTAFLSKFNKT